MNFNSTVLEKCKHPTCHFVCTCFHVSLLHIKTLTLESVAQTLQSVDPSHTTRLSSDAPGSPAERGQRSQVNKTKEEGEEEEEEEEVLQCRQNLLLRLKTPSSQKNITTLDDCPKRKSHFTKHCQRRK